jgi:citrate synthase
VIVTEAAMTKLPDGTSTTPDGSDERRAQDRRGSSRWRTAITRIEPNTIAIRGYAVDELMGRLSFGEAIYLLLRGELPTPSIGLLFEAVLVSSIDHGVTPPSTLAARNVATTGAPIRASVAAGVLGFGAFHGGDIESCMRFLESGLGRVRDGASYREVAAEMVGRSLNEGKVPTGFGHRIHSYDPRAVRLLQLAQELELDGEHIRLIREIERVLHASPDYSQRPMPLNVDGAIAAVCGDLGFDPGLANPLFIIARVPGLIAHAQEERERHKPMRQIDPVDHVYDGPPSRRLPETRQ